MNNDTLIKVTNRSVGTLSYDLPELAVKRNFIYRETKEIPFSELRALYNTDGGKVLVKLYLAVHSEEAVKELGFDVEPEYFYSEEDVIRVMEKGSYDAFLDMLDFAPDGVIDMIKTLAVTRELNDMNKRNAILEKFNFNVTKGIEAKNAKYDNGDDADTYEKTKSTRRVAVNTESGESTTTSSRRTAVTTIPIINA